MPNGLFKYFSTDEDKLERFTNGQVYLTPPKYLNDPWDFFIRSDPPTVEQVKKEGALFVSAADLPEFDKSVRSADAGEELAGEMLEAFSKTIGLVCLTEEPLGRIMWAHYGESHRGFVAEFQHGDEEKSDAGFGLRGGPFGSAVKVDYQPELPVLKQDRSNMEQCALTKHLCWKHEQEWRVIWPLKNADLHPRREGFFLRWFRPTNLLRVILGLNAAPEVKFRLKQMLNHTEFEHVRREQASIESESRRLKSRPLSC
jgi:hypothetical protein